MKGLTPAPQSTKTDICQGEFQRSTKGERSSPAASPSFSSSSVDAVLFEPRLQSQERVPAPAFTEQRRLFAARALLKLPPPPALLFPFTQLLAQPFASKLYLQRPPEALTLYCTPV